MVGAEGCALEEDVSRFDIAVDDREPVPPGALFDMVVAVVDEGKGFAELEIGVPDKGLGDGGVGKFEVVAFDEGGEITARAVVEVKLRFARADERRLQVNDAGVWGEGVAEKKEFGLPILFIAMVRDDFADDERAL